MCIRLAFPAVFDNRATELKFSIYLGAVSTVIIGPEIVTGLGFPDVSTGIACSIGAVIGVFAASILFGIPVVLLNINANLAQAVDLLKTMQQPRSQSGLVDSLTPVLFDHALRLWNLLKNLSKGRKAHK